jgi:predicted RecA/RadA family phage recombinase
MNNYLRSGETITWTNNTTEDVLSGEVVELPAIIGVASATIKPASTGVLRTEGVFVLPKTAGQAVAQGQKVYILEGVITTQDSHVVGEDTVPNTPAGVAWNTVVAAANEIEVAINR